MKYKFTIKLSLIFFFFITIQTSHAQKSGYINSTLILSEMPELINSERTLEALQKRLQKEGQAKVTAFQQKVAKLQDLAQSGQLTPQQQQEESSKLEKEQAEIEKFEQEMVYTLESKRNELLEPIYAKLNEVIKQVAKENSIDIVLESNSLLYGNDAYDLTTKVKSKLGL
jgi:outer membrane protein